MVEPDVGVADIGGEERVGVIVDGEGERVGRGTAVGGEVIVLVAAGGVVETVEAVVDPAERVAGRLGEERAGVVEDREVECVDIVADTVGVLVVAVVVPERL